MSRVRGKKKSKKATEKQFLTLTFDWRHRTIGDRRLFASTICPLIQSVRKFSSSWRIVPELQENGMLHYHILFKLKSNQAIALKIFRGQWQREFGFTQIRNVYSEENVTNYMSKEDLLNHWMPDLKDKCAGFFNPKNYVNELTKIKYLSLRVKPLIRRVETTKQFIDVTKLLTSRVEDTDA